MSITIKPLEPHMADTFVGFFQRLQFDHSPSWASCYCQFYQTACSFDSWMARTGDDNRKAAVKAVKAGEMKGFLAFNGDACIGWVNANKLSAYPRLIGEIEDIDSEQWGTTICYVIDPEFRGQGVATELLKTAMGHFKHLGLRGMLALPVKADGLPEKHYRGRASTYEKMGFSKVSETDTVMVMQYLYSEAV